MGTKVSSLTALTGANTVSGDRYTVLDVSDTSQGPGGTLKTHTRTEMAAAMATAGMPSYALDGSGNVTGLVGPGGQKLGRSILSNHGMERVFFANPSNMTGYTMVGQYPALGSFYGVKVCVVNPSTNSGANATFDTIKVAAAPTSGNAGSALTWSNVTFSGAASIALSAGSGSGGNYVPSIVKSDLIPLANVARTDSGTLPLVQIRAYASGILNSLSVTDAQLVSYNTLFNREYRFTRSSGTVANNVDLVPSGSGFTLPMYLEFYYTKPVISLVVVGDSISAGLDGTNYIGSPIARFSYSNNSSQTEVIVVSESFAVSGQTSLASMATATAVIPILKPNYLVFCPYSVNDGTSTQATIDASWLAAMNLIDLCIANNVIPVLATACPQTGMAATPDGFRKVQNTRIRALSSMVVVLDYDSVVSDRATPASYTSGLSNDGTHPSNAGYTVMAAEVAQKLSTSFY